MIEYAGVIIGVVVLIVLALVSYYFYNKVSTVYSVVDTIARNQRMLEAYMTRPPPRQDIEKLMKTTASDDDCDDCYIKPVKKVRVQVHRADEDVDEETISKEKDE